MFNKDSWMPDVLKKSGINISPVPIVLSVGSSFVSIEWPAISGAISYEVFLGETDSGPWVSQGTTTNTNFNVTGLESETPYWVGVIATVLSSMGDISFVTTESIAPTIPNARAIIGRSQTLDFMFGGGGNTGSWWGYAGLTPPVTGPTPISWSVRIKNKTNMTWGKIAIPFLACNENNASLIGAWVGVGGSGHTPSSAWQQITFSGNNTISFPSGTQIEPYTVSTDEITLPTVCPPNETVIIRVGFSSVGEISLFDSLSDLRTPESDLASCSMARGDFASNATNRDTVASWEFWGDSPFHAIFVEGIIGSPVAVSELFVGDSVIQGFRAWSNVPEAGSRDSWLYQYELINNKNVRLAVAGNGGFSLVQYCQRLLKILPVYKNWLDVVVIEGWTPNFSPTSPAGNAPLKVALENAISTIQANSRGVAILFPSPACLSVGSPGVETSLADMLTYCLTNHPTITMDLHTSLADPLNLNEYDTAYSFDALHQNLAGNAKFASDLKPINETVLTSGIGYSI